MRSAVLAGVVRTTPRTRRLRLALSDGPFPFRAGQAVFAGLTGAETRAPYSIASPPSLGEAGVIELLVSADSAFGQTGLDPETVIGAAVDIDGPVGMFGVPDAAVTAPLLLVAGGTGIAPLRSVLLDRLERIDGGPATLVYSVRTSDEFAFAEEFEVLAAANRLTLHTTVTRDDSASAGPVRSGRVDETLLQAALHAEGAWCLVCGPAAFVQHVTDTLARLGVEAERLVVER